MLNDELYNYALELMMLKILLKHKMIDDLEYNRIEGRLKKAYKIEYLELT